jgi:hypothetical protein
MKVTAAHLALIRDAVEPLDTPALRARYAAHDIARAEVTQDFSKRYRWDLLWAAVATMDSDDLRHVVYDADYWTDHLDTALRAVVPPLDAP